jgi:hypothetical protein
MITRRYPWWCLPAVSLVLGLGAMTAFWVGGELTQGLVSLAIIGGLGIFFAVGGRFEAIRGLRGDGRDEYWASLDTTATTIAGLVLITLVIALAMWEWAHGRDGSPYSQLGAIAGATYIVALVALRLRR